jgi:signal transduction histidine kinase
MSEAMTNAARHARAGEISVELNHEEGMVQAVVSDDGTGMLEPPGPLSHGIRSMVERADLLGGTLTISETSKETGGTTVRLAVPLSRFEVAQ